MSIAYAPLLGLCRVWHELELALAGRHNYGSTVAEIYEYNLTPSDPLNKDKPSGEALLALVELCRLFAKERDCNVYIEGTPIAFGADRITGENLYANGHRYHVRVESR